MAKYRLFYFVRQILRDFVLVDLKLVLLATTKYWLVPCQESRLHPLPVMTESKTADGAEARLKPYGSAPLSQIHVAFQ